jgi:signal transduction histidine kinase
MQQNQLTPTEIRPASNQRSLAPTRDGLIFGSGEMADRTRNHNWSNTSLGPMDQWPEILLNTVNMLLSSRQPMLLWWGTDLIQFYNDAYRASLGDDKHPASLGRRATENWPEIWPVVSPLIGDVMQRGESHWSEDRLIPIFLNGNLVDTYWTFSYSPVWDATGNVRGTLAVCTETTRRILAENSIRAERGRLMEVLQQAPMFFALLHGPDHVFTMVNPLYTSLVNNRDVIGKTAREALPEAADQGYIDILDRAYRGESYTGHDARFDVYAGEGNPSDVRYLDFVYQPLRELDGSISGVIVLGIDVTERKQTYDALLQSEKLAAVGRLASSIAHEINNPLESVTNLLYIVRGMEHSTEASEYLEIADRELRRVAVIANQTLRFHKQAARPTEVTGNDIISSVLTLYHGRIINGQVDVIQRHTALRPVLCFEGEVRQVISNLVGNALDAMRPGGRLHVRSREGADRRTGRPGLVITVADSGPGMPPEVAEKVFQAFYTTKGFLGTGLGLWISREIIIRHSGRLCLRTSQQPGHTGTAISVFLPFEAAARPVAA